MNIIPAIDIIEGKAVRLQKGNYDTKKVYSNDPLDIAKEFESIGIKRLHMVDLDGAKAKQVINVKVLEDIAKNTNLEIDFGGGIKSDNDIRMIFDAGAKFATIGSIAVNNPELFESWLHRYGSDKIILGADVKNMKIAICGWMDLTEIDLSDFLSDYQDKGVKNILCTDISRDGMLQGPSIKLYTKLVSEFLQLNFIASGGVSGIDDVYALNKIGVSGVIIGKAYYEGRIVLDELEKLINT